MDGIDNYYEQIKTYLKTYQKQNINHDIELDIDNILFELIVNDIHFDLVKLIIDKQIFDNEYIFNYSLNYNNYRVAKFLLHYDASILHYDSLFSFLLENGCLDIQKINFILNIKTDKSYRVSELLCQLIEWNELSMARDLLNNDIMNSNFVIDILSFYKNKTALSNEELKKMIYHPNYNNSYININEITKYGKYPLLDAIEKNDTETVRSIMDYAKKTNTIIELNIKDEYQNSYIFKSFFKGNLDIIKLLFEYAKENNIVLNLNEKKYENYLILIAMENKNNIEIVQWLIDYAQKFNIILDLNVKNYKGESSLLLALESYSKELVLVQLLIDYAQKFNIILELNVKNYKGDSPLLIALKRNMKKLVQLLIEYAKTNNIVLKIVDHDDDDNNILFKAIKNYNYEFIHLLMDYAKDHHTVLDIYKDYDLADLLFYSVRCHRFNVARLLVERGVSLVNNIEGIIRYLSRNNSITLKNIIFLLNMTKENTSINSEILCKLIKQNQLKILKKLLNYNDMNIKFVKKSFLSMKIKQFFLITN